MYLIIQRARTAKKIETAADIEGFPEMKDEEKEEIKKLIAEFDVTKPASKTGKTGKTGGKASKGSPKTTGASQTVVSPSRSTSGLAGFTRFVGSCLHFFFSGGSPSKRAMSSSATMPSPLSMATKAEDSSTTGSDSTDAPSTSPDNLFSEFRRVCQLLEREPSYNAKTKIVADFIKQGSSGGIQWLYVSTLCMNIQCTYTCLGF